MPPHPEEIKVTAGPGAIILRSAHLWHSGTFNNGAATRLCLDIGVG